MRRKSGKPFVIVIAALTLCSVVVATCFHAMEGAQEARAKHALPQWVQWESRDFKVDLDGDNVLEVVSLNDKTLKILDSQGENAQMLPEGRYTADVLVQDIDFDGVQEIITLTWKKGSYGPYHPFWISEPDDRMTEHIFIFTFENGQLKDKWLSSDVRIEIASLSVDPLGRLCATLSGGIQETLEWQGWGLTFLDETTPSWNEEDFDAASLVVMGDVIAHNAILEQGKRASSPSGFDFTFLFKNIAEYVDQADIAIVNQEGPLVSDENQVNGEFFSFGTPAEMARAYKDAGFDVIALANNHMMDRGVEGFLGTIDILNEIGLIPVGFGAIQLECRGITIGVINATFPASTDSTDEDAEAYLSSLDESERKQAARIVSVNDGGAVEDQNTMAREGVMRSALPRVQTLDDQTVLQAMVRELHDQTDFVLCYLHLGEEYGAEPTESDRQLIAQLIDAGADAVVCTHPHVVQLVERVVTEQGNSGVVFYSLGNLVSNQTLSGTQEGLCAQFVIAKPKNDPSVRAHIVTYQALPTHCVMSSDGTTVYLGK